MSQAENALRPIAALDVVEPETQTRYPEPFASLVRGRTKRRLGDHFGLETVGVNLVRMGPGSVSSVRHHHSTEDELIYILSGTATLITDSEELLVGPGMCAGFKAGSGQSHQLANRSQTEVVFIEVGARFDSDSVVYPYDDLALKEVDASRVYTHKDGRPYPTDACASSSPRTSGPADTVIAARGKANLSCRARVPAQLSLRLLGCTGLAAPYIATSSRMAIVASCVFG